jgi:glycosyltransferase involved in cell wall biosynthesis
MVIARALMEPGLVSIIVPVFNRAALLREAVASALGQTYRPIEVIIVDDASTDDTPRAIDELVARHPEIRPTRRENGGPGQARESGRQLARGEFIQYLDSDDLLLPRKLELQVAALRAQPECGVAYGITRYRDAAGSEIACTWKAANQVQSTMFPSFLLARWWETVTPLYRRAVCDAAGPWSTLRLEEDWEYDCRVAALGTRLAYVAEVVGEHRHHLQGRLSQGAALDPERLRQRAGAHALIYAHARRGGIGDDAPEMQHFARELFHLARQCGAAGLAAESRNLFELARQASGAAGNRMQFRTYRALARLVGWSGAGKLASMADRLR